jgi:diguanylate cyclase (GGDEF)-like protein/PAS domain S-box-containing protein
MEMKRSSRVVAPRPLGLLALVLALTSVFGFLEVGDHALAAPRAAAKTSNPKSSSTTGELHAKPSAKATSAMPAGGAGSRKAALIGSVVLNLVLLGALGYVAFFRRSSKAASANEPDNRITENPATIDNAMIGIASLDTDGHIVNCNRALQEIFCSTAAALRGKTLNSLVHPDDMNRDRTLYAELTDGARGDYQIEQRYFRPSGDLLWARLTVVRNEAGSNFASAALVDITRRKLAEDELAVTREAIHNLYQVVVAPDLELNDKMRALLEMGCRRFGVETGLVGKISDHEYEVLQVISPDEKIRRGKRYDVDGAGGAGQAKNGTTVAHPPLSVARATFSTDWRDHPFYAVVDRETYLGAPIIVNSELFGTVSFSSAEARPNGFAAAETEFVQLMAQWLGNEIERLQARAALETKQTELMEANTKLEALATHDGLTGVKNRRAFDERLDLEFNRSRRYSTPLSILLLDVDRFKHYNDTFGHPAGDQVLRTVGRLLQSSVRNIDFVARYGGEEFVVLLPNTDAAGALILGERLRAKIEGVPWKEREVTASFGAATLTEEITERTALTAAADMALYYSKTHGRNRITHIGEMPAATDAGQETPAAASN